MADEVDKRKVTMRNVTLQADGSTATLEAVDYVRPDMLDAYVADARTRWQFVGVSDEPDAGPGGYEGDTAKLDHLEGRSASDFTIYGDASTPENALDFQRRVSGEE